ncbi:MAG: cadherin-like beta sandwich domain-containing protein [Bacilli bacterium]|nr:cadherin-like beta sandwich domain-containing protein [Bacilli bacterium]
MKKIKYLLLTLLLLPITGKAAVYHCSAPSSVESGETISVTISGNLSSSYTTWSGLIVGEGNASYSSGDLNIWADGPSFSRTVYFTAGNPGTATFYVGNIDVSDENQEYSGSDTCRVNITSASRPNGVSANIYDATNNNDNDEEKEIDPDKSANNYLKTLSIDGIKISPAFNKDKLEYTAVVNGDKDKITIKGEVEDEKANVDGLGEKELKEGINKFEVVVTAENGQTRKYTISVTRKEMNPIEVTINKKKYTVAKKEIGLKVPDGFVKTTLVINKEEVIAYSNSFTGYLLVALVDEDGNAAWFIYNQKNGTYTKYSEFKSNGLRLIVLEANKKDIPYKYKRCKVEINGELVDGYALQLGSDYRVVYALNMDTGEKNFYLYDMQEKTFQRFYNTQVELYRELLKKLEIGIIGLGAVILIMFIIIFSQFIVIRKTKRFVKNGGKKEKEEPIIDDDDDKTENREDLKERIKEKSDNVEREKKLFDKETDQFDFPELDKTNDMKFEETNKVELEQTSQDIDVEEKPMTREEMRRLKREKKREMAEARRDFFD